MTATFVIARNPAEGSTLPYLLRLPLDGGLVLRAKAAWPTTTRVFCLPAEDWPDDAEVLEQHAVRSCARRGVAVDLVLERPRLARSQFVFTNLKGGRPAVFWQTPKTAKAARPGQRVPRRRAFGQTSLVITVDTRERYGYRFTAQQVAVERRALRCGDYAVTADDDTVLAAVERKSVENLTADLVDGSLGFQLAELATVPRAVVVVEGRYSALLATSYAQPGFLADLLAGLQVRFCSVPIVFCDSRKMAEEYTFRFLGAARAELAAPDGS